MRIIIGVTRSSAVSAERALKLQELISRQRERRFWLIDRLAISIGRNVRKDLATTLIRHFDDASKRLASSRAELNCYGLSEEEIAAQWALQNADQRSIRQRESRAAISKSSI